MTIIEDNQGCIQLIKSDQCGGRTKHIDVSYLHVRDLQEKKIINIQYCPSDEMLADLITKPLPKECFFKFIYRLGICNSNHPKREEVME